MDENALQIAIEQYKQQFLQVQTVLQSTGEENQEDLVKLRDDLVELISVSEESLLSIKKCRLLQLIEEQEQASCNEENIHSEDISNATDGDNQEEDDTEDITGMKCRVTYTHEWGGKDSYNAMVFSVDPIENESQPIKVRVLFMNPTHKAMVPCPYFLDGKCRFTEDECRYSHGYLVDVEELKPFKEPDFTQMQVDQKCLARYDDGVWYKATIQAIKHDVHEFDVHFDTYNMGTTLGLDAVLPIEPADSVDASDDENSSSISSDNEGIKTASEDEEEEEEVRLAWKPSGGPLSLGDWEQHTTGIGSKLMAKMGYIFGKGLGKDGSGRVEPVEVVVLPKGKSLDRCAELRQQGKIAEPFKKKKKKRNKNSKVHSQQIHLQKEGPTCAGDIFSFINSKLGHKKGKIHDIRVPLPGEGTSGCDTPVKTKTKAAKNSNTNWNLQLFKIHEEIKNVKKQLQKDQGAVSRQQGESSMARHFEEKLARSRNYLAQLEAREKSIQHKLHQSSQHKKLTVF